MAKTLIFESYSHFLNREDKTINGVSIFFSSENPDFEKENKSNEGCWNCSRCSRCSRCSDCSDCSDCSRCSGLIENKPNLMPEIPIIQNIHQKVLDVIQSDGCKLQMDDWHSDLNIQEGRHCGTTHCRAGWVVYLAGVEGRRLEEATLTEFAAKQIYKASSKIRVSPNQFYTTDEKAMADIVRCAELERDGKIAD